MITIVFRHFTACDKSSRPFAVFRHFSVLKPGKILFEPVIFNNFFHGVYH